MYVLTRETDEHGLNAEADPDASAFAKLITLVRYFLTASPGVGEYHSKALVNFRLDQSRMLLLSSLSTSSVPRFCSCLLSSRLTFENLETGKLMFLCRSSKDTKGHREPDWAGGLEGS